MSEKPGTHDSWLKFVVTAPRSAIAASVRAFTYARVDLDNLLARLKAADESDRHNWAVIDELKRQLKVAVQERNDARTAGLREGVLKCRELALEYNLLQHISEGKCECDPDVGATPCMPCAAGWIISKLRALLDQPGDQAKE